MNFNTLDLNLLVVFDAILRTRSVTLAGENVHLSQSAMSNALKRLRRSFNDPLFVRTSMGMLPTPYAEQISKPIQDALAQIKATIEAKNVFDPAKSERTFRIYMTDVGQMVLLPDLLERIPKEAPHVNLQTVQVPMHHREEAMESGEVDLAVGYLIPFEGHFYRQKLFTETYVCMVRAGHPTIGDQITLREFLTE